MSTSARNPLRALPSVDALINSVGGAALVERYGRSSTVEALRAALAEARARLRSEANGDLGAAYAPADLLDAAAARLHAAFAPSLRPVINASGIIIHTNLGRAPLSEAAQRALIEVAAGYSTLEYDLAAGARGSRLIHAEAALKAITGAEAALVVNNNAAALVLLLSALAQGREVILSRGQLIEIGGGFRVPEIMAQSGAILREVGTTNRTRAADYVNAIGPQTALIMRAHASNFKLIGFVEETPLAELAAIAHRHDLLLVDDLGSGALLDTAEYGLDHEPTVGESLAAGADLVAFSADKLLGGPQGGIVVGRAALIERLKRHPLARAVRADKLCLAALSATLDHYRRGEATTHIPVWRMIAMPLPAIEEQAEHWAQQLGAGSVIPGESAVGGGSLPGATLSTRLLALTPDDPNSFAARLRAADPPVIARIVADQVVFDPRTVLPNQTGQLLSAVRSAL
ncbi:MAG: L-seryl-tRNA(Sec) selenium transferase [Aggregatilineales bacterium]